MLADLYLENRLSKVEGQLGDLIEPAPLPVSFVKLDPDARLPVYSSAEAAGADIRSIYDYQIEPFGRALIQTGLGCNIPNGWELQVRPRSGLANKKGLTVLNAPGTVDSDYTGELCVILANLSPKTQAIKAGERIAQIVLAPVHQAAWYWTDESRETERGANGFGSTGLE